jgi:hypothetical protein
MVGKLIVGSKISVSNSPYQTGAAIALTAAIFINIGLNFQKLGFRLEQQRPENVRRPVYLLPVSISALSCRILSNSARENLQG